LIPIDVRVAFILRLVIFAHYSSSLRHWPSAHHVEAIADAQVAHQRRALAPRPRTSTTENPGCIQTDRRRGYRAQTRATIMAGHFYRRDHDDELAGVHGRPVQQLDCIQTRE